MTLSAIQSFVIPKQIVDDTDEALRAAGIDGFEAFVLWTGLAEKGVFRVMTSHVPRQLSFHASTGACVRVDGRELHRLNVWLYEHNETLAAQIHSHPREAYHSDTDDEFPIATTTGSLSIVVPDFGSRGLRSIGTVVYRLVQSGWEPVDSRDAEKLLHFEGEDAAR